MRPRVTRPIYLTLLAIAGLVTLSYFPLARTRAGNVGATIVPSSAKPLANLKNPQTLKVTYAGSADAVAALQSGTATPTALAAADFNADGAMDVVAGYSTKAGGVVALFSGNPDAYAPKDTTLYQKAMQGKVPATFLSKAVAFTVPESPDFIATGDFNRDANKDVLVAARGGNVYLLAGDGNGNLLAPRMVSLPGQVRAMAAALDGHVAVSFDGSNGSELAILAPGKDGLAISATYPLPTHGDSVEWGSLGTGADVAVGAGAHIAIVYGPLGKNPQTETVNVPFQVKGLTLGDFIWDRDNRTEIAALADDGSIQILQHGTLNTAPLTKADLPARAAAIRGKKTAAQRAALRAQIPDPTAVGEWTVAAKLPYAGSAPSGALSSSAFSSPRLAASTTHDVMILDAGRSQLSILDTSGKTASPSAAVSFTGAPIAALALPQKINANRDVVVLTSAQSAPMIITAGSGDPTYNVNTTADVDTIGACTSSSVTTVPSTLSLREAVCLANNNGAQTYVINLPAGTYSLSLNTGGETGELQTGTNGPGANISIVGAGAGSTIIQQTDNVDRIIEQDFILAGNNPLSLSNLTIQNGLCANNTTSDCTFGGGAILGGGEAGSNLTLTNVTMTNNQANPTAGVAGGGQDNGGAISFEGPTLSITSSTFSSNVASGGGGAIEAEQGFTTSSPETPLAGSISITTSTFTNNTNVITGGGVLFTLGSGYPGSISGSTFTLNKTTEAHGLGGGISTEAGTFTLSNSRIVGNTTGSTQGTGVAAITGDSTITNNWWGCNAGPGVPANNGTVDPNGSPNPGCDSLYQDTADGFTMVSNPWLVLSISANPTQIDTNDTSTLTANLTTNSSGTVSAGSVPNGTPVTFGGTLDSSVNPTSTTLTSGQATSTYTAGSTAGAGTGTATVDNQEVSTPIDVLVGVTVTTSPGGLSITVDGVTSTAPQTFNWVVGSSHTIATTSPQNVSGGSEQAFTSWSDGGAISHSVTAPSSTTTYTASFATQYQLTTAVNPAGSGTVTPTSGNYYTSGTVVPLTATANAGYSFTNWTGNVANSTSASTSITMTAPQSVTANFSLIIVASPTTTSVSSNNNPSFTAAPGNSVTFTATVTSNTTVNEGTITFSDPANDFTCSGGNTVAVSNGQATCQTSFTTEGSRVVTAAYNGTVNFQFSSGMITQTVNNHTVVTGNQFCNQGAITVPSTSGAATPYPSNIFVTGLGNVGTVTVALNNISSSDIAQTDLLLVGPTGAQIIPFASVGDGSTIGGVNVVLDDAAASLIPGGSPLISGSYKPTSITGSTSLAFPAPAPIVLSSNYAATDGTATLTSTFQGTAANGTWALYAMDNAGNGAGSIGGGWCVNISPATVQTTITTSPAGLLVSADGGTFTAAPLVENWIPGSSHTIATSSPQAGTTGTQFVFSAWSDSGAISHSITVPSTPTTYTASFNTQYQLTTAANPSNGGTVSPVSGNFYNSGTVVPLLATANSGFNFSSWTGNVASSTSASTTITMSGPQSVTANFVAATVQITVTTSPANLLVSVDGGTFTAAPLVETWNVGSSHTIATTSPQAGTAGVQYVWSSWSDSGAISHSITVPSTATTYTASFNTQYQLTTAANPGNGGTVSPASGTFYNSGTVVPLTATPNTGFAFSSWTGNVASATSASTTITMTAPQSVTANFTATKPMVNLKPISVNFGTVHLSSTHSENVTVTNVGSGTLTFKSVSLTEAAGNPDSFTFLNSCGATLAPTKSCTITIGFSANKIGSSSATLNIADNAASSPQHVPLSATVINPRASLNPQSINFATHKVGSSTVKQVTLTNTGTTMLDILSIAITGTDPGDFSQTNTCPSSLGAGDKCTISVTFDPQITGGRSAGVTVTDNAVVSSETVTLAGTGD